MNYSTFFFFPFVPVCATTNQNITSRRMIISLSQIAHKYQAAEKNNKKEKHLN